MSVFFTIVIFFISIFLTQFFGGKKIFYIRFFSFLSLNLFLLFLINYLFNLNYFLINFLLCLSLIFSWSGFVIHISNSIFLSLLKLIHENHISSDNKLFSVYNQNDKFSARLEALYKGGYLVKHNEDYTFNYNFKKNFLLKLIIFLKKKL